VLLATTGKFLHGQHLQFGVALGAVGQARGFAPAEAASDAPSDALVPANIGYLCHKFICHGLRFLLLHPKISH
jgi:hypothetical protein